MSGELLRERNKDPQTHLIRERNKPVQGFRACVIDHYRQCVRDEMLGRIVCFGSDPVFIALCQAMADDLDISLQDAGELLWPTAHAIYQSAEAANGLRR